MHVCTVYRMLPYVSPRNADARTAVTSAVDSEENKEDRLQLLGRIAEAVAEDDMEQLKRSVEAYRCGRGGRGGCFTIIQKEPRPRTSPQRGGVGVAGACFRRSQSWDSWT